MGEGDCRVWEGKLFLLLLLTSFIFLAVCFALLRDDRKFFAVISPRLLFVLAFCLFAVSFLGRVLVAAVSTCGGRPTSSQYCRWSPCSHWRPSALAYPSAPPLPRSTARRWRTSPLPCPPPRSSPSFPLGGEKHSAHQPAKWKIWKTRLQSRWRD